MLGQQSNIAPSTSSARGKRKNQNYKRNKKDQKLHSFSIQQGSTIDVQQSICQSTDKPTTSVDPLGTYDAVVCDQTYDVDMVNQHIFILFHLDL